MNRARWELASLIAGPALFALTGAVGSPKLGSALLVFAVLAEVPSIVAYRRRLPNRYQIYVIDILACWLIVGWIVALVMAVGRADGSGQHRADGYVA